MPGIAAPRRRALAERKQRAEQLRHEQELESLGILAGGMAHDLNELLTVISGYSGMILARMGPKDATHYPAVQIALAAENAAAITRQLLECRSRRAPRPRMQDLNEIVSGLGAALRELTGEGVGLSLSLAPGLSCVRADVSQLRQVVINLAVNACHSIQEAGRVTIETSEVRVSRARAGSSVPGASGNYVLLLVRAVPEQTAPERRLELDRAPGGNGDSLTPGMAAVLDVVRRGGGFVDVSGEPGGERSVSVFLPHATHAHSPSQLCPGQAATSAAAPRNVPNGNS